MGAFRLNTSNPLPNHTHDVNVEAVRNGLLTGRRARRALEFMRTKLATRYGRVLSELPDDPYMARYISPYMTGIEVIERLRAHDGAEAMRLLRTLWGHMVNIDPGTLWEKVDLGGRPAAYDIRVTDQPGKNDSPRGQTSLAHPFAAAPVPALSGYVLGLRPTGPGWRSWIVEPQPLDLRWAQGQVGTPHGPLVSRWRREPGARGFRLTVRAPRRTRGTVAVPLLGAGRTIAMDGRIVWRRGRAAAGVRARSDGRYVRFYDVRGAHTFAW